MNFKSLIITIGFMAIGMIAFSQTNIKFSYDASGNRITREIDLSKSARVSNPSNGGWEEGIMDQLSDQMVRIYPNPTKGRIKVEIPALQSNTVGKIYVYDINGRIVFQQNYISSTTIIDINEAKNGFYFLKLIHKEQTLEWKIVKQ